MPRFTPCLLLACLALILLFAVPVASAQSQPAAPSAQAQMIVTVRHDFSAAAPALQRDNLIVTQGLQKRTVASVTPLRDDRAGLELFLLVDTCSNCEPDTKFQELRKFILAQPATTAVGIAYLLNGKAEIAARPSADHESAAKALRTPSGGDPSNPYGALTDLIKNWQPASPSARRVVILVSSGIDSDLPVGSGMQDPYAESAIAAAQRSGAIVYAIYHPSADYGKAELSEVSEGQVELAHVANETGGEAYFLNFEPLPTLTPFLDDIADHLANQYLVEIQCGDGGTRGSLEQVSVKYKDKSIDLMAPDRVWIPGSIPAIRRPL